MSKRMLLKRIVQILLLIALLILLIPFPVQREYVCTEYQMGDPDYRRTVHVFIKGRYHINLSDDVFRGTVEIPEYQLKADMPMTFYIRRPGDWISYWTFDEETNANVIETFGHMRTDFFLRHLFILFVGDSSWMDTDDGNWYRDHSRTIIPGEMSYDEAVRYAHDITTVVE